jgi:hypothetical protein
MEFQLVFYYFFPEIESFSERIPRGLPRGKRANIIVFFLKDRRFPAACGGELQYKSPY